jgi:hypothetical protein
MAVVAAFTVPAETFPLGVVFESFENVTVELERVVPLAEGVMPYLWVHGADREAVEAAFATELPEQELEVLDSDETDHLVRVRWSPETDGFLQTLLDSELSLLSAEVTTTEWTFEVRAPGRPVSVPGALSGVRCLAAVEVAPRGRPHRATAAGWPDGETARSRPTGVPDGLLRLPATGGAGGDRRGTRHLAAGARLATPPGPATHRRERAAGLTVGTVTRGGIA